MKDLASRLHKARKRAGLRLSELDIRANLTTGHTGLIESRKRVDPHISTVVALADALGVSVGWLATGKEYGSGTNFAATSTDAARKTGSD